MSDDDFLMRMVKEYRTADLERRLELMPQIIVNLDSELRLCIRGWVAPRLVWDVLQETLIAVFTSLANFKGNTRGELFSWCRRIILNKATNEFRKDSLTRMEQFPLEDTRGLAEEQIYSEPLTAEIKLDLDYALNLLDESKPMCRELLWNHYIVDMDYAEIAEELGLNYDAIRMKIKRCLDDARDLLDP